MQRVRTKQRRHALLHAHVSGCLVRRVCICVLVRVRSSMPVACAHLIYLRARVRVCWAVREMKPLTDPVVLCTDLSRFSSTNLGTEAIAKCLASAKQHLAESAAAAQ